MQGKLHCVLLVVSRQEEEMATTPLHYPALQRKKSRDEQELGGRGAGAGRVADGARGVGAKKEQKERHRRRRARVGAMAMSRPSDVAAAATTPSLPNCLTATPASSQVKDTTEKPLGT